MPKWIYVKYPHMKILLILTTILLLGACTTTPLKKKVVGEYERESTDGTTYRLVFLENGAMKNYLSGQKTDENKWAIVNGEIHVTYNKEAVTVVHRINTDISITWIARIWDGKRKALPKEDQFTYKRIK
tara:strand:+ start:297 stop:683 length:387 start_codon:yes stop_codon:yes gene_type:complete